MNKYCLKNFLLSDVFQNKRLSKSLSLIPKYDQKADNNQLNQLAKTIEMEV